MEIDSHFISVVNWGLVAVHNEKGEPDGSPFLNVIGLEFLEAESDRGTNNGLVFAYRSVRD